MNHSGWLTTSCQVAGVAQAEQKVPDGQLKQHLQDREEDVSKTLSRTALLQHSPEFSGESGKFYVRWA